MTSVASFGGATTAGNYTLVCSGTRIGQWVESFRSATQRLTGVRKRSNFWSSVVFLDGYYPAQVYEHEFTLYTENGSLHGFIEDFFDMSDHIHGAPLPLAIHDGDTATVVFNFGNCYMEDGPELQEPDQLLLQRAGFLVVRFIGATKPTVP